MYSSVIGQARGSLAKVVAPTSQLLIQLAAYHPWLHIPPIGQIAKSLLNLAHALGRRTGPDILTPRSPAMDTMEKEKILRLLGSSPSPSGIACQCLPIQAHRPGLRHVGNGGSRNAGEGSYLLSSGSHHFPLAGFRDHFPSRPSACDSPSHPAPQPAQSTKILIRCGFCRSTHPPCCTLHEPRMRNRVKIFLKNPRQRYFFGLGACVVALLAIKMAEKAAEKACGPAA